MNLRTKEISQPEPKLNNEQKADEKQVSPSSANAHVKRSYHRWDNPKEMMATCTKCGCMRFIGRYGWTYTTKQRRSVDLVYAPNCA